MHATIKTNLEALKKLRDASFAAQGLAISTAAIGHPGAEGQRLKSAAKTALRELKTPWGNALKAGDTKEAIDHLKSAKVIAAVGGDDAFERKAIALLVDAEKDEPTPARIRAFRDAAGEAGDLEMVKVCDRAAGGSAVALRKVGAALRAGRG